MSVHIFGNNKEWAISEDDGCLRFHPQYSIDPEKVGTWIWKEAFDEVEKQGGFEALKSKLRGNNEVQELS